VDAAQHGWRLMFADQYPYAGGKGHYAAYLENVDGFEAELVALGEPGADDKAEPDRETRPDGETQPATAAQLPIAGNI
jgi:hypothetical protein